MTRPLAALLIALGACFGAAQTYVYQRAMDIGTLDPLIAGSNFSAEVAQNLYETLYGYGGTSLALEPRLATNYAVSNGGRTYTFYLRSGVTFHSGNRFTCNDVKYSFMRNFIFDPGLLTEAVLGPGAVGAWAFGEGTPDEAYADYWSKIDRSVRCENDKTVVITVLEADPGLLSKLNAHFYSIIDSEWVKANGMWDGTEATWRDWIDVDYLDHYLQDRASGTGAFRLVEWESGERLVAERYADYWGPAPTVERVIYRVVPEETERVAALIAGEADQIDFMGAGMPEAELAAQPGVTILNPGVDESLPWGIADIGAVLFNYNLTAQDNPYIGSGELNGDGIPPDFFTDVDVRKCFSYSFDAEGFGRMLFGDASVTLTMALAPQFGGYDPNIPRYGLDREKAERHCRAAWNGEVWENGFTLALPFPQDHAFFNLFAQQLRENLAALNEKFVIEVADASWGEYFDPVEGNKAPMKLMASQFAYPDAAGIVPGWYQSGASWPGLFGYKNDEIDRLLEEVRTEFNEAKRNENYRRVGRLGYEDAAFILLPNAADVVVVRGEVSGVYRNPARAGLLWRELTK